MEGNAIGLVTNYASKHKGKVPKKAVRKSNKSQVQKAKDSIPKEALRLFEGMS